MIKVNFHKIIEESVYLNKMQLLHLRLVFKKKAIFSLEYLT